MIPRWEQVAESRWGTYTSDVERETLQHAIRRIPKNTKAMMDVGCEGGRWSRLLADTNVATLICTDIDADALEVCRQRIPRAECHLVDPSSTTLPAGDAALGLVLCFEVAEVVHEDWFLDEVARVLAPGGVFACVMLNRASYRLLLWAWRNRRGNEVPHYVRSYRDWRRSLRARGFTIDRETGMCWMPFGRQSNSKLIAPLITLERTLGLRHLPSISPWVCVVAIKA